MNKDQLKKISLFLMDYKIVLLEDLELFKTMEQTDLINQIKNNINEIKSLINEIEKEQEQWKIIIMIMNICLKFTATA